MLNTEVRQKIREYIPNNFVVFRLKPDSTPSEVQLKSAEWAIITKVDGQKTMQEIMDSLNFTEDEALLNFYNLISKKLIEPERINKPQDIYVDENFFKDMEQELVQIIGPVAGYLIEDVLIEIDETRNMFTKEKVPILIESVSQEINDEHKRVQFQQKMLKRIKLL